VAMVCHVGDVVNLIKTAAHGRAGRN
jgi:hypothetical protein